MERCQNARGGPALEEKAGAPPHRRRGLPPHRAHRVHLGGSGLARNDGPMVELSAGGDSRCNPKCWRVWGCSAMAEWPGQDVLGETHPPASYFTATL
eukprot:1816340-Prorocentrum_lima.AAC.1